MFDYKKVKRIINKYKTKLNYMNKLELIYTKEQNKMLNQIQSKKKLMQKRKIKFW